MEIKHNHTTKMLLKIVGTNMLYELQISFNFPEVSSYVKSMQMSENCMGFAGASGVNVYAVYFLILIIMTRIVQLMC